MALIDDLLNSRTLREVVWHLARACWAREHDGAECSAIHVPFPETLGAWKFEFAVWDECREHVAVAEQTLRVGPAPDPREWTQTIVGPAPDPRKWDPTAMPSMRTAISWTHTLGNIINLSVAVVIGAAFWLGKETPIETANFDLLMAALHVLWREARKYSPDLKHPLAFLVHAWQQDQLKPDSTVTTTVTGGSRRGMTRSLRIVSTVRRVDWDSGRPGAIVDGEPMAAALPDPADLFPVRQRRPRRVFQPGEQMDLALSPPPPISQDLRLLALQEVSADPAASYVLPGDVLVLLTFAHLADQPFYLTQRQGAALIVRNLDGEPRAVQPQHDYPRFWRAAYALRVLALWEPAGGYRWVDLAIVEVPRVRPVDRIIIGPPAWARGAAVGKWTLTAEGSAASLKRVTAGKQSLAGRIVTGLEYRLASGWSGKPNTVAPYLRPAYPRRAASPGYVKFVSWREALYGAGDWWDVTDPKADKAALNRYARSVASLEKRGYFVGENLRREAPAGDSVEIVCRHRAARGAHGYPAGLLVRASARFVEAARLAQLPRGAGFEPMLLTDYTGLGTTR